MAVHEVQSLLREAVRKRLEELTAEEEVEVFYDISAMGHVEVCPGEEGEEEHLVEKVIWRLNLYVEYGDRYLMLHGMLPYTMCSDGDTEPMTYLTDQLWSEFKFASMMSGDGLDEVLTEIAQQAEKES